ncbi:MAG: hypothetical protein PUB99_06675, partial [Oscillospiraceae bacterium]|nr:hypothetical protein [Oscillospiraceae bacterium]
MDKCLPLLPFFCTVVYALGDVIPCEVTIPSKLHGMEAVQNIARESRFTLSHRRIILPHFSRVGFYPTLSYLILL